ncbi:hypothetical protein LO772_12020 [Yinghuangia sp. ASG 101]|uniref:hypothetical protein n=1 Tax=Yinghuangia sp. ASG 101 TaxID=2896848 RepID=UPI001E5E0CBD|nr:hypothetical protein [Yinghuangia sp. ASG 101]UGQ14249.1 hypothetical protein LO772_12020 [Yinghuangia sp. ASG 101]
MGLPSDGPMSTAAVEQLKMDLASMREFETTVLGVLEDLTAGDVVIDDPVAGRLKWDYYGTGFEEAYHIALSSSFMVEEVRRFARMLSAHIEAMALTIRMAGDKTLLADESARHRLALLIYGEPGKDPRYNVEPAPPPTTTGTPGAGDAGVG